jgi:hypothetical protein
MSSHFKDLSKYALEDKLSGDFGHYQKESFARFHKSGFVSQNEFLKSDIYIIINNTTTATAATTIIISIIDLPFLFFYFFFFAVVVVF